MRKRLTSTGLAFIFLDTLGEFGIKKEASFVTVDNVSTAKNQISLLVAKGPILYDALDPEDEYDIIDEHFSKLVHL